MRRLIYCSICRRSIDVSVLGDDAAIAPILHEKAHLAEALARIAGTGDEEIGLAQAAGRMREIARSVVKPFKPERGGPDSPA